MNGVSSKHNNDADKFVMNAVKILDTEVMLLLWSNKAILIYVDGNRNWKSREYYRYQFQGEIQYCEHTMGS